MLPTFASTALLMASVISAAPFAPATTFTVEANSGQLDGSLTPVARDLPLLETRQGNCLSAPGPRPAPQQFNDRANYHLIPVPRRDDMNPISSAWVNIGINDPARNRFPDGVQIQMWLRPGETEHRIAVRNNRREQVSVRFAQTDEDIEHARVLVDTDFIRFQPQITQEFCDFPSAFMGSDTHYYARNESN